MSKFYWDATNCDLEITLPSGGVTTLHFTDRSASTTINFPLGIGMTNPMTTAGDLIVGGTDGTPERLAIGTSGKVLMSNGTTAAWVTPVVTLLTTEVETQETYLGSPVYSKVIQFGAMANAGSKSVAHNITGLNKVISVMAIADNGTDQIQITAFASGTPSATVKVTDTNIVSVATGDMSSYSMDVTLKYTK